MQLKDYSSFSSISEYESYQKRRILNVLLIAMAIISIPMAFSNLLLNSLPITYSLVGLFVLCIVGLYLNLNNYYVQAAAIFTTGVYAIVVFSMIDGSGLRDSSIVALPIVTVFSSLLFNPKISTLFTFLSCVLVIGMHVLQVQGVFDTDFPANIAVLITIITVLLAMNVLQFTVMRFWRRNLDWVLHSEEQLKDTYDKTLEGWAKALEFRDRETEGHSRRVVALTTELARAMGIQDEETLQHIMRGALLHDIGKMGIPDRILQKKGPLTEEEWKVIKTHPRLAEELMAGIPFLAKAREIPSFHHERWDGSGYPYGLAKEEIPLAARIFTVIDYYDALRSDRPYRKAWGEEKTLRYIQENTGTIFDPAVVDTFLHLMKNYNI